MKEMKKCIYLMVVFVLVTAGLAGAEEQDLKFVLDVKYMSKYMSKGIEAYSEHGAVFETLSADLWGSGWGVAFGHQSATGTSKGANTVDKQRFNSSVYYGNTALEGEQLETKYKVSWTMKNYYGRKRNAGDSQEFIASFSWPSLLGIDNLTPYYVTHYETPRGSDYDSPARTKAGWVHRVGLATKLNCEALPNPIKFTAEAAYNDGYGGDSIDHDWSHITLGMSTKFQLADNMTLIPGIYYQTTMEDSVSAATGASNDIVYSCVNLKYAF
jgi:hypothetical protein